MNYQTNAKTTPIDFLMNSQADLPVLFFAPSVLAAQARVFLSGFEGLVTYAVKANPDPKILAALNRAGVTAFDVASVPEIELVRATCPKADLHYNNPIRSRGEIAHALHVGVQSFSVDTQSELQKLSDMGAKGVEVSVRLALPIAGAAYDFGEKFGATSIACVEMLRTAMQFGFKPSMTFHPGTQCNDPAAWDRYIRACAEIARKAGVTLHRLNVGGGFPSRRGGQDVDLHPYFTAVHTAAREAFGHRVPFLVCEPGRAMVAEAGALAIRIKAITDDGTIFLNDGVYGGLTEFRDIDICDRILVMSPSGHVRRGPPSPARVFGPTCDSIDVLPNSFQLPLDAVEGDFVLIHGMGAYVKAISTPFNGYGEFLDISVEEL